MFIEVLKALKKQHESARKCRLKIFWNPESRTPHPSAMASTSTERRVAAAVTRKYNLPNAMKNDEV